jgi:hypothetical protein
MGNFQEIWDKRLEKTHLGNQGKAARNPDLQK